MVTEYDLLRSIEETLQRDIAAARHKNRIEKWVTLGIVLFACTFLIVIASNTPMITIVILGISLIGVATLAFKRTMTNHDEVWRQRITLRVMQEDREQKFREQTPESVCESCQSAQKPRKKIIYRYLAGLSAALVLIAVAGILYWPSYIGVIFIIVQFVLFLRVYALLERHLLSKQYFCAILRVITPSDRESQKDANTSVEN